MTLRTLLVCSLFATVVAPAGACEPLDIIDSIPNAEDTLGTLTPKNWEWEAVPLEGTAGAEDRTSVALGPDGGILLILFTGPDGVNLGSESNGSWSSKAIGDGVVTSADALVVADDGAWFGAFSNGTAVEVASADGIDEVATAVELARSVSIVASPSGAMHVAFGDDRRLMLVTRQAGSLAWSPAVELAEVEGMRVEATALAGADAVTAVAFTDWTPAGGATGLVKVAFVTDDGAADLQTVTSTEGTYAGHGLAAAFDTRNQAWLAYGVSVSGSDKATIVAATSDGSLWLPETVATVTSSLNMAVDLAVNGDDQPLVAFYDADGALRLASRGSDGTWTTVEVDSGAQLGRAPALLLNETGKPVLSYHDSDQQQLLLAR